MIYRGTTLYHYEVAKHSDGFKINVDNYVSSISCHFYGYDMRIFCRLGTWSSCK